MSQVEQSVFLWWVLRPFLFSGSDVTAVNIATCRNSSNGFGEKESESGMSDLEGYICASDTRLEIRSLFDRLVLAPGCEHSNIISSHPGSILESYPRKDARRREGYLIEETSTSCIPRDRDRQWFTWARESSLLSNHGPWREKPVHFGLS